MKIIISSLFVFLVFQTALAQNSVGNGGDAIAGEFVSIARASVHFLKLKKLSDEDAALVAKIEAQIKTVVVESVTVRLFLGSREVDAINYPKSNKIQVSRSRWDLVKLKLPADRAVLVMHEFVWMSGVDDSDYATSARLVKEVEVELNRNSISVEQYQATLSRIFYELLTFRADVLEMQKKDLVDNALFCMGAGALSAYLHQVEHYTKENSFWFPPSQIQTVEGGVRGLKYFVEKQINHCRAKELVIYPDLLQQISGAKSIVQNLRDYTYNYNNGY